MKALGHRFPKRFRLSIIGFLPIAAFLFVPFVCSSLITRPAEAATAAAEHDLRLLSMLGEIRDEIKRVEEVRNHEQSEFGPRLRLDWSKVISGFRLNYERRIDFDLGGQLSLLEIWTFPKNRLDDFLQLWGHPSPPTWEECTGEMPDGIIFASKRRGTLTLLRSGDDTDELWRLPPYPLNEIAPVPFDFDDDEDEAIPQADKKRNPFVVVGHEIRGLITEIVLDELQDVRGVPLTATLKKVWEFDFGDLVPILRLQRRVRMEMDDTFTVIDVVELDVNLLLGYLRENSSTGVSVTFGRRAMIFRKGYTKWYKALFSVPFNPADLPWNVEKLKQLPEGVRIVFPASTGLYLVDERLVEDFLSNLPNTNTLKFGLRGTFFLSLSRLPGDTLELRFGGRVERVFFLQNKTRFTRRYKWDPIRLLGTITKLRLERVRGARLFYMSRLDLNDEEESRRPITALKKGLRMTGFMLGGAAVGNLLFFLGDVDQSTLDRVISDSLPEFPWDRRIESKYFTRNWYGKLDLKLASISRGKWTLDDDWKYTDLESDESISGVSGWLSYKAHKRLWRSRDRYDIQVHFLSSRGRNEAIPLSNFVEIFVKRREKRASRRELGAHIRRTRKNIDLEILEDAGFPGYLPNRDIYRHLDYSWHMVLERKALDRVSQRILAAKNMPEGSVLRQLAKRHPYHFRRVERAAQKGISERNARLAHFFLGMIRWRHPVQFFLTRLPKKSYLFEWSINAGNLPVQSGACGGCAVPEELRLAWQTWEELSEFDDLFTDLDAPKF